MFSRWFWRSSATIKEFVRSDEFPLRAIGFAVLAGGVALVFRQQLFGAAVFIGESDRLNTYLNMRLAEYDALQAYGRVPAWNPTMFGGFSVAALHWMNPGTDPIAYLLQLFPRDRVYQALGYVSIALVLAACATAYFYIRDLTGARIPAAIAAFCYGLSVFGVHRIAQVDNAYLILVLLPAAMLAIRRLRVDNLIRPFVGLTLSMSALAIWGFLQEVAYAFCFLAAYTLYRAAVSWKSDRRAALGVLIVFGASSIIALLLAAPRLITVGAEFFQLTRTSAFQYSGFHQLLRFFHEGIYGRYFAEGRLIGNSMNFHEGLQLVSSTTVAIFVCFGLLRPTNWFESIAGLILFAMIFALVPIYRVPTSTPWPSQELINIGLYVCILVAIALLLRQTDRYFGFGTAFRKLIPASPRPMETAFHLFALAVMLFLILVPEALYAVYLMFGRADFSHTRLSILALLPLCSLFAIYLAELKILSFRPAIAQPRSPRALTTGLGIVVTAAFVSWLIHGPVVDQLVPRTTFRISPYFSGGFVMPAVVAKVVLTIVILAAALAMLLRKPPRSLDGRTAAAIVVATFAFVETATYAHFKVNGSQNWTYPVPFGSLSYMDVPTSVMQPPTKDKLEEFADKLEINDFRSVLLTAPSFYAGPTTPHITQFWRARMVGGYGGGVPERLAALPWPEGVVTSRTIELRSMSDVNPALLALLNVKYLVFATRGLYFNTAAENQEKSKTTLGVTGVPGEIARIHGISFGLMGNPVPPLPRHFLAATITGVRETPRMNGAGLEAQALPASENQGDAAVVVREGIDRLTSHSLAEDFRGTQSFDFSGPLDVEYYGDVIDIRVRPSNRERFVVVNERYHPDWRARAQTGDILIFPTNAIMMGIRIPANLNRIELRFEPFTSTRAAHMVMLLALLIFLAVVGVFWFAEGRMRRQTSMIRRPQTADRPAINDA
jgi:hypothetical protein